MPTTTSLSNYEFINLGPLTTTYTAPESCATMAFTALANVANGDLWPEWSVDCDVSEVGECVPSGLKADETFAALSTQSPNAAYVGFAYYSPGIRCPSGWETAGIAAKNAAGDLSTSGGVYDAHIVGTTTMAPIRNPPEHIFAQALDTEETAALCCPSGYSLSPGVGMCHTSIPMSSLTVSSLCKLLVVDGVSVLPATFTYDGETITGDIITDVGPTRAVSTRATSLGPDATDLADYSLLEYMPVVTLAFRKEDLDDNGEKGGDSGSHSGDDGKNTGITWGAAGAIKTVLGIASIAGLALFM